MEKLTMDKIVSLCKNRGYIYAGSEIYGGLANTWDYGPLGVELKNNIKNAWRKKFIQENKYNVGLDAAILMNPETWVASGHVGGFSDPLIDCKECKTRHRADKLIEEWAHNNGKDMIADGMTDDEMIKFLENDVVSQLMHIIDTPLHELGKETMIGEHCECDRQQCVACWIQKKS